MNYWHSEALSVDRRVPVNPTDTAQQRARLMAHSGGSSTGELGQRTWLLVVEVAGTGVEKRVVGLVARRRRKMTTRGRRGMGSPLAAVEYAVVAALLVVPTDHTPTGAPI